MTIMADPDTGNIATHITPGPIINIENLNLERLAVTSILLLAPILVASATGSIATMLAVTVFDFGIYLLIMFIQPKNIVNTNYPVITALYATYPGWGSSYSDPHPYIMEVVFDDIPKINEFIRQINKYEGVIVQSKQMGNNRKFNNAILIKKEILNKVLIKYESDKEPVPVETVIKTE